MLLVVDSALVVAPAVVAVWPVNWRTVRFQLSTAPDYAISPAAPGDALNPLSWSLERADASQTFTPISVAQVDPVTFDVSVSAAMPSHLIALTAGVVGLIFAGTSFSATIPIQGMQWAAVYTPEGRSAQKRQITTDLANPPAVGLANTGGTGGTLQVQGGDYANVTGDAFVKKMIYRLLVTPLGGFFHLPDWGTGILNPKGLLAPAMLLAAKGNLERTIKNQIPEVAQVQVQLSLMPTGVLFVVVNAVTQPQGNAISVTASSQPVLPGAGGGYVNA